MRVSRLLIAVAVVGSTLALGLPAARADLTANSWYLGTNARDGSGASTLVIDATVSNVFSVTRNATHGGSSSTTIYDFDWDAVGGSFNADFDHQRAGASESIAQSFGNTIKLTVTGVDLLYDFSGAYSMIGGQLIVGRVNLWDVTATTNVFDWFQQSSASPNESFVVGQDGDGESGFLIGSPSGTLLAGHTYDVFYNFFIQALPSADSGATADGDFHLDITPVPAPGAAVLAMTGLPLVGWFKRRFA